MEKGIIQYTVVATIINLIILCIACAMSFGSEIPKTRFVNAIIGEAEGEVYKGKLAVACTIRERGSLRGVYGERAPRVLQHKYSPKVFVDAVRAYEESANTNNCEFVGGATHWEGTKFKTPYWAKNMIVTATIGNQRFYKTKGGK